MATKPRIALCMEYPLAQLGGTEVLVRTLAQNLQQDFEIVLVTDDTRESYLASGISGVVDHVRWDPLRANRGRAHALVDRLAKAQVYLAHFHFGGTFMWGNRWFGRCPIHAVTRRRIPCITTVHLVHSPLEGYIGPQRPLWVKLALFPLAWGAKCYTLSRTAVEFAVSRHDLKILQGCSGPLASKQRLIYHSAVREAEITPGTSQRQQVILCVGTIGPRKGQAILVAAFHQIAARFPTWRLVLVGRWDDGDEYSKGVLATIKQSPLRERIHLLGRLPDAEVRQWMRDAAIFAMPSTEEGLGLSLQEALLSGCPAVGTRAGGIPELIDDDSNGVLVEPGDASAFAEGLARLMADPPRRDAMSQRARDSVLRKGMTLERMIAKYKSVYHDVLESHSGTGLR